MALPFCSGAHTFCKVRVHLRQIASLDAFEAQLDFISGLMDDIEQEERRLLDLSSPLGTENGSAVLMNREGSKFPGTFAEPAAMRADATSNVKGGSTTRTGGIYILCAMCTFLLVLLIILIIIVFFCRM